jgi:hypothetical protein
MKIFAGNKSAIIVVRQAENKTAAFGNGNINYQN